MSDLYSELLVKKERPGQAGKFIIALIASGTRRSVYHASLLIAAIVLSLCLSFYLSRH